MNWTEEVEQHYDELVEIRRYLHQHPELSFKEEKTAEYIYNYLTDLGIHAEKNIGGNGVVGKIKGGKPGPSILLRADFDALPIQDEKDVPYKSMVEGVMHACGHDAHTAMLLISAKILKQHEQEIHGTVVLCHQHAEEHLPGGAKSMISSGLLEDVDYVFGTHTASYLPSDSVSFCKGATYANADGFTIKVQGKGGHGAAPHETFDAINAAAHLVTQFQTIVSRSLNPIDTAVVTVGTFKAGDAFNVVADTASLTGTIRTYKDEVKSTVIDRMNAIMKGIEESFSVKITMEYQDGYPALYNPEKETDWVKSLAEEYLDVKVIEAEPTLGGEDFSYFLQHKPGCYFNIGVGNATEGITYPHHHPKFDVDEKGLIHGVKMFLNIIQYNDTLK